MIEIIDDNIFHLRNDKISYVIRVLKNGHLGQLYFGNTLGQLQREDFAYLTKRENKSAGTVKYFADDSLFTLHDQFQELPVYGTSDFKAGVVTIYENETPLYPDFMLQGFKVCRGRQRDLAVPGSFADAADAESLIVTLRDQEQNLELELTYTIFAQLGTISRAQKITNLSEKPRQLQRFMSGSLDLKNADFEFLHLSGAWLKERHVKKHKLTQGTVSVGSLKGASSHQHNPFVALQAQGATNEQGVIYGANLIYSGNFLAQAEVDEWDHVRLQLGIHPEHFSWELAPGQSFAAPEMILTFTQGGINGLIQESARFVEKHVGNPLWRNRKRPVVLNSWEAAYFDFDHTSLVRLAREGQALGMDCLVVDDGWFGKRNNDRVSLGDWYVDESKFPQGFAAFAAEIHGLDMQLGLWFEPEMISPDSDLYRAHPEWVVKPPRGRASVGRGQYVLDFADPRVVDEIYQQMKKVIAAANLDYLKWDMNRNITEAYSNYLANQGLPQTEFFHRYILGVYRLYEKLLTDFPELLIEGCAGGGGRYDLGILFYSPQIWPSDDSDAVERLAIQGGTLLGYPLASFSNHVSASPNHQVKRATPLAFRQTVAMFGPLGYELDLFTLTPEERSQIKAHIAFYKEYQELLLFGDFRQLLEAAEPNNEVIWSVSDESGRALVAFFRKYAQANPPALDFFKLPFVDNTAHYVVNGEIVAGSVLRNIGLRKPYQFNGVNHDTVQVSGDYQAFIYRIEKLAQAGEE